MTAPTATILACLAWLGATLQLLAAKPPEPPWPQRILLTHDNGIDDMRTVALARALSAVTEVHVVAASTDRSWRGVGRAHREDPAERPGR